MRNVLWQTLQRAAVLSLVSASLGVLTNLSKSKSGLSFLKFFIIYNTKIKDYAQNH